MAILIGADGSVRNLGRKPAWTPAEIHGLLGCEEGNLSPVPRESGLHHVAVGNAAPEWDSLNWRATQMAMKIIHGPAVFLCPDEKLEFPK